MQTMYPGVVNSPQTELAAAVTDDQTTIPLVDASRLPAPPNLATIGAGETAETIFYSGVDGNDLTGVTRGFQGQAQAWSAGQKVARYFTEYDHGAFIANIEDHEERLTNVETELAAADPIEVVLGQGTQIVNATQESSLDGYEIEGRTLVNQFPQGFFEAQGGWDPTINLDSTTARFGTQSGRVDNSSGAAGLYVHNSYRMYLSGKKMIFGAWAKAQASGEVAIKIILNGWDSGGNLLHSAAIDTDVTNSWTQFIERFDASQLDAAYWTLAVTVESYGLQSDVANFDGLFVYVISDAQYAEFPNLTAAEVAAKYPTVRGMQSVRNPYVLAPGENLNPPFFREWGLWSSVNIDEPYTIRFTPTDVFQGSQIFIPVEGGAEYSFTVEVTGAGNLLIVESTDEAGNTLGSPHAYGEVTGGSTALSFTTVPAAKRLKILLSNSAVSGQIVWKNIMLTPGTEPLPFVPQQPSYKAWDVTLRSNPDGTYADKLIDGGRKVLRKQGYRVLDGSLPWVRASTHTGFKRVALGNYAVTNGLPKTADPSQGVMVGVKYDGKILDSGTTARADAIGTSATDLFVSVSNADSGWGEGYDPTDAEIRAFFYGWRMYVWSADVTVPYTSGTKAWAYLRNDGNYAGGTQTLPTYRPTDHMYPSYQLQFQLAQPVVEDVESEGEIALAEGPNQLTVGAGMVLREAANPVLASGSYYINNRANASLIPSSLSNRLDRFFSVYKNAHVDDQWTYSTAGIPYGRSMAYLPADRFDPAAAYSATYTALDMFNFGIAPQSIRAEYQGNLNEVVNAHTRTLTEYGTRISVVENQYARKQQPGWIPITLLNAWVNAGSGNATAAYKKDDLSVVRFKGRILGGTTTDDTALFPIPVGYRPKDTLFFQVVGARILISPLGFARLYSNSGYINLEGISYYAEQ